MNFDQAKLEMEAGNAVRLSDWMGYWYMENGNIMVHTRDGNILNTPNLSRYRDRNDWELAEKTFGFPVALMSMLNGKKVREEMMYEDDYMMFRDGFFTHVSYDRPSITPEWVMLDGFTDEQILSTKWTVIK